MIDLEVLLSRQQKEDIVRTMFLNAYPKHIPPSHLQVTYDRRYSWLFGAQKRGRVVSLIISVNITDPQLQWVVDEAVRGVLEMNRSFELVKVVGDRRVEA